VRRAALWIHFVSSKNNSTMKICQRPARCKPARTLAPSIDPIAVAWVAKRYRLRLPIALIVAAEAGLGAR
jgi:hypothetical protein